MLAYRFHTLQLKVDGYKNQKFVTDCVRYFEALDVQQPQFTESIIKFPGSKNESPGRYVRVISLSVVLSNHMHCYMYVFLYLQHSSISL